MRSVQRTKSSPPQPSGVGFANSGGNCNAFDPGTMRIQPRSNAIGISVLDIAAWRTELSASVKCCPRASPICNSPY